MKNKKQNRISSNLVRNSYRDIPEDHHDRMRFEGCGNSLGWLHRPKFDSSVGAHSVRKDFRVTHVHSKGFLAVSAHNGTGSGNCQLICCIPNVMEYERGVKLPQFLCTTDILASGGDYVSAAVFGHSSFREDSGRHWIFTAKQFHCQSTWPSGLTNGFMAARLLGLWAWIPPGTWLSFSCVVCCQEEISASGRSLVRRSPTECHVSECNRGTS